MASIEQLQKLTEETNKLMASIGTDIKQMHKSGLENDSLTADKIKTMIDEALIKAGEATAARAENDKPDAQAEVAELEERLRKAREASGNTVILPGNQFLREDLSKIAVDLRSKASDMAITSIMCQKPVRELKMFSDIVGGVGMEQINKAMDTADSGAGAEWVFGGFSSDMIRDIRNQNVFLQVMRVINFKPKTSTLSLPFQPTTAVVTYHSGESTADAASNFTASDASTAKTVWTAAKHAALVYISTELEEDSVAPFADMVADAVREALSDTIDKVVMRGDEAAGASANINKNDGTPTTGIYYLAMDGLAKLCIDGASGQTRDIASLTAEDITATATLLGKYAANPSRTPIVCDRDTLYKFFLLKDANNNLVVTTLDKFGAGAPILSGQIAAVFGFPILVSDNFVKTTEGQSGEITTAGGTLKGGYYHFYGPGAIWAWKRQITIKRDEETRNDQAWIVGTMRSDVQFPFGVNSAVLGYDID